MNITEGVRTTMENPNGYTHETHQMVERVMVTNNNGESFEVRILPNKRKSIK